MAEAQPTNRPLPLILVRGFGGLSVDDEKRVAYQGFNDGTVYPQKRGENYIYEGMVLRFMKSDWTYHDATNVVGYYGANVDDPRPLPPQLTNPPFDPAFFTGDKVVIDAAMALELLRQQKAKKSDPCRTLWVFRYYDLNDRNFSTYGRALVRLIDFIRALATAGGEQTPPPVNIIAHSMGGLIVRHAVQETFPGAGRAAKDFVNKIVTLGTPHQGISFQFLKNWINISASAELEAFNPERQKDEGDPSSFKNFAKHFPLERLLTVVGTNYRSYSVGAASFANRIGSVEGEGGWNYNRSDGLVKQTFAQIPGAPRTFVHKCHGGGDSLVTSREAFEVASRFFFGNIRARLRLHSAKITRGKDFFGKSEFFLGVSIKPRRVDFDLFHQSPEAENCYGPFRTADLSDPPEDVSFDWANNNRLIWEGFLDTTKVMHDESATPKDLVFRLDFYVGERDTYGVGFSDNVIFRKQYYVRVVLAEPFALYLHTAEDFAPGSAFAAPMKATDTGWLFDVKGTGFDGTFAIEIDKVPEAGDPVPIKPNAKP